MISQPASIQDALSTSLIDVLRVMLCNQQREKKMRKKKIIIKVKEAKRRNPIARVLCTDSRFKTKRFKNKKKTIEKFDWEKEEF